MEDDDNFLINYKNYISAKEEFRKIINEFNYYKHKMIKESLNLKMENKSKELKLENQISNLNTKQDELSKIVI